MKAFLICPVRGGDHDITREYVAGLEAAGWEVHWPVRDTDQEDAIGVRICVQNLNAIRMADRVFILYDPTSEGSLFDLGMAFALGKPLSIVYAPEEEGEGKSFGKVIRAWADENEL